MKSRASDDRMGTARTSRLAAIWGDARVRMLAWGTLAALLIGTLGLTLVVDDYLRMARNAVRSHPPTGQTVVVGIDEHSLEALGSWPWSRATHAKLLDRLTAGGAKRVFFDIFFNSPGATAAEDKAFARSIKNAGNVWLAAGMTHDRAAGSLREKLPMASFRKHANVVSVATKFSAMSMVRELPYAKTFEGQTVPSMAARLAGVDGRANSTFVVDYAIDLDRIRTISAVDVIQGVTPATSFRGKDVVVAVASPEIGDVYFVPGHAWVNGGYINVLGAETLLKGRPADLGWLAPMAIAFLLAVAHVFAHRRWLARLILGFGLVAGLILPIVAESNQIFFDTVPALVLLGSVAANRTWRNFRQSYKVRGDINPISGLPNLNALRSEKITDDAVLVGARVRNYAEISSALPPDDERALVAQITGRLALGARGASIYQGDEGIFVWVATPETAEGDHIDALHALFRSPALIDRRSIDLSVTFGIDASGARELANRIGATLVAADEAATEGLRWKVYDPAKLADAEWKLSLLGRLDAAIDSGEVWVAYQPQLDVRTGRISGAEALVRWSHPEKGEISPAEFVLAAEQHDRIDKLTRFVLRDAIKVAADFNTRGIAFDVAVNLSARLLERPGLTDTVRTMLADARLSPERLTLEVTESAAMTSGRGSIRTLEELGSLGISVSIDDYGTGFSTLEYFKLIPAAEVKIDRSFIAAIDKSASDRLMVSSTIELAHSLGRTVVAEGVETSETLAELTKLGCDKIQGYLIGRPMKVASLKQVIDDRNRSHAA